MSRDQFDFKSKALYRFKFTPEAAEFILADSTTMAFNWLNMSDDMKLRLMAHGLKQKIVDAAAMPRDVETGRPASDEDKITAMRRIGERLQAGEWAIGKGEGGGARSLLARALDVLYPNRTRDRIDAFVAALDKKQQATLRRDPKVAPIIAGLRPVAKTAGIDTADLMAELL